MKLGLGRKMPPATSLVVSTSNLSAKIDTRAVGNCFCNSKAVVRPTTPAPTTPKCILTLTERMNVYTETYRNPMQIANASVFVRAQFASTSFLDYQIRPLLSVKTRDTVVNSADKTRNSQASFWQLRNEDESGSGQHCCSLLCARHVYTCKYRSNIYVLVKSAVCAFIYTNTLYICVTG